ncbi:Hypothetical protein PHPALM_19970 [Phytophthora palmivora]|uniref:Uncharacterized protein n=1 Tax=Phytophthora palmivora TaxID=4796 RepID=A0A2P4XG19_9STRA|nr:Hypothetical protein PHPALM_19970 [Phytophthora palmivora]
MKQTGFAITEEMMMRGVQVEDLIEKACPFYERMNAMFWAQANVEPVSQMYEPVPSEDEDMTVGDNASDSDETAQLQWGKCKLQDRSYRQ